MFYFNIKEICSILCIFGKTRVCLVLHDFNLTYCSSIILGSFTILLFPKLCWHIGLTPKKNRADVQHEAVTAAWKTPRKVVHEVAKVTRRISKTVVLTVRTKPWKLQERLVSIVVGAGVLGGQFPPNIMLCIKELTVIKDWHLTDYYCLCNVQYIISRF